MLKATDLMVGNIVNVIPSGLPIRIAAVHNRKVGYHSVVNRLEWVREAHLEPIPLTREILEKNGMKFDSEYDFKHFDGDNGYLLELNVNENGEVWWTMEYGEYEIFQIKYVHQLQNIMKTLGIKKEINV